MTNTLSNILEYGELRYSWYRMTYSPALPGYYLVAQSDYRWVRYWNGKCWKDLKTEQYGEPWAWTILPSLPVK